MCVCVCEFDRLKATVFPISWNLLTNILGFTRPQLIDTLFKIRVISLTPNSNYSDLHYISHDTGVMFTSNKDLRWLKNIPLFLQKEILSLTPLCPVWLHQNSGKLTPGLPTLKVRGSRVTHPPVKEEKKRSLTCHKNLKKEFLK